MSPIEETKLDGKQIMRFHHSTRRGRNRLGHNSQQQMSLRWARYSAHNSSTSRWSHLNYCRETNIHFNRRLPVEPPKSLAAVFSPLSETSSAPTSPKQTIPQQQISQQQHRSQQNSPTGTSSFLSDLQQHQQQQQQKVPSISGNSLVRLSHKNSIRLKQKEMNDKQQQDDDLRLHKLSIEEVGNRQELVSDGNNLIKSEDSPMEKQHFCGNIRESKQYHSGSRMGSRIDMESAREKLIAQVQKHRLWSSKAAKRMQLTSVQERFIYIYELISFCERRDLEWRYEPYKGGLVPSIPYRHVDQSTPSSLPLSKIPPESAKSLPATTTATSELLAFSPIHKKTVLVESSQSQDSFWSPSSPNSSFRTAATTTNPANSIRTTTSTTSGSMSSRNSPTKKSNQYSFAYDNQCAIDRPIPSAEFVWSIDVPAQMKPEPFYSQMHSTELPNSSFVKRCHGCQGKGKLKCNSCNGVGYEVCISCHGNGTTRSLSSSLGSSGLRCRNNNNFSFSSSSNDNHHHNYNSRNSTFANGYDTDHDFLGSNSSSITSSSRMKGNEPGGITNNGGGISSSFGSAWVTESCHFCHGAGQKRCLMCAGKSYNHCAGCLGSGQLRCYLNLNITWINHRDEIILNNSDNIIPKERLHLCSGIMLLDEINEALAPLSFESIDGATGRIEETNQLHIVSKKLLDKHKQTYRQERLIKQVSRRCC